MGDVEDGRVRRLTTFVCAVIRADDMPGGLLGEVFASGLGGGTGQETGSEDVAPVILVGVSGRKPAGREGGDVHAAAAHALESADHFEEARLGVETLSGDECGDEVGDEGVDVPQVGANLTSVPVVVLGLLKIGTGAAGETAAGNDDNASREVLVEGRVHEGAHTHQVDLGLHFLVELLA